MSGVRMQTQKPTMGLQSVLAAPTFSWHSFHAAPVLCSTWLLECVSATLRGSHQRLKSIVTTCITKSSWVKLVGCLITTGALRISASISQPFLKRQHSYFLLNPDQPESPKTVVQHFRKPDAQRARRRISKDLKYRRPASKFNQPVARPNRPASNRGTLPET